MSVAATRRPSNHLPLVPRTQLITHPIIGVPPESQHQRVFIAALLQDLGIIQPRSVSHNRFDVNRRMKCIWIEVITHRCFCSVY